MLLLPQADLHFLEALREQTLGLTKKDMTRGGRVLPTSVGVVGLERFFRPTPDWDGDFELTIDGINIPADYDVSFEGRLGRLQVNVSQEFAVPQDELRVPPVPEDCAIANSQDANINIAATDLTVDRDVWPIVGEDVLSSRLVGSEGRADSDGRVIGFLDIEDARAFIVPLRSEALAKASPNEDGK